MFEEPSKLILGLLTGIVFGVLLQKGQVAKFDKIIGQLLLRDFTVVKIMATAVAVGALGVNFLISRDVAELHIQEAFLGRVIGGGLLFGVGMAIIGLCPGTTVAACGEGRRDAMVGVVGMLAGAGAYVAGFAGLKAVVESFKTLGKVTLPQLTHTSVWLWAAGVAFAILAALLVLERRHPARIDRL